MPSLRARRMPVTGRTSPEYWPSCQSGSVRIASRCSRAQRDGERRGRGAARDADDARAQRRELRREREHRHAAERRADDGGELLDARASEWLRNRRARCLRPRDPGNRAGRRGPWPDRPTPGPRSRSSCRANSRRRRNSDRYRAPCPARPSFPTSPGVGSSGRGRGVRRRREAGEQQDGVVACGVELAPGFVRDLAFRSSPPRQKWNGSGKRGELRGGAQAHVSELGCAPRASHGQIVRAACPLMARDRRRRRCLRTAQWRDNVRRCRAASRA